MVERRPYVGVNKKREVPAMKGKKGKKGGKYPLDGPVDEKLFASDLAKALELSKIEAGLA